jgi:hypothetical protein
VNEDERQLWRIGDLECVMISCCSGAELQLRRIRPFESLKAGPSNAEGRQKPDTDDSAILLREMHPMKSDLYDRARDLRQEHGRESRR